jgi:hypothetical protein
LPLRHASFQVLKKNSSLYPREGVEVNGARLVERWALRNLTSFNASFDKNIGRTIGNISVETVFMARQCSYEKGVG